MGYIVESMALPGNTQAFELTGLMLSLVESTEVYSFRFYDQHLSLNSLTTWCISIKLYTLLHLRSLGLQTVLFAVIDNVTHTPSLVIIVSLKTISEAGVAIFALEQNLKRVICVCVWWIHKMCEKQKQLYNYKISIIITVFTGWKYLTKVSINGLIMLQ